MCSAITSMADKLDLCFTDVALTMAVVDKVLQVQDSQPSQHDELKQHICTLRQHEKVKELEILLPVSCQSLNSLKWADIVCCQEVLNLIDEAWQEAMGNAAINAFGCMADEDYALCFESYVTEASSTLKNHLQMPDIRIQVDESLHPLLDSIPAKFKLVSLDFTDICYGLPILTRTPLALLPLHFNRIPLVLMEMSRWCDPLVDYQVSLSKSSNAPSYTQAAIDAIGHYESLERKTLGGNLVSKVCLGDEMVSYLDLHIFQ